MTVTVGLLLMLDGLGILDGPSSMGQLVAGAVVFGAGAVWTWLVRDEE